MSTLRSRLYGETDQVIATVAKASVGKIVFTNNIAAGDVVKVNGVAFTALASDLSAAATAKIVFTGNLVANDTVTVNGVTFTCKASGASGELEFDVGLSLSASLDALITALNGCTDPDVSLATYTKTDTNTAVTMTVDADGSAGNGLVISSDHDSVTGTSPTSGGVDGPTAYEFVKDSSLSASLDALVSKLNASTDPLVSIATYSKTDTNTALTMTVDATGAAGNNYRLWSDHSSVVITQPRNGENAPSIDMDVVHTKFDQIAADTMSIALPDGIDGQRKVLSNVGLGTVNVTSANDKLPGSTNQYALNGDDVVIVEWYAGKWRLIVNDGAVAT